METFEHGNLGRIHVKMKAVIEIMHSQAKECQRWPADHQKQGKRPGTAEGIILNYYLGFALSTSRTMR